MTGTWTPPPPPPHSCEVPKTIPLGTQSGAVWRCNDCGNAWVVEWWEQYSETGMRLARSKKDDDPVGAAVDRTVGGA